MGLTQYMYIYQSGYNGSFKKLENYFLECFFFKNYFIENKFFKWYIDYFSSLISSHNPHLSPIQLHASSLPPVSLSQTNKQIKESRIYKKKRHKEHIQTKPIKTTKSKTISYKQKPSEVS